MSQLHIGPGLRWHSVCLLKYFLEVLKTTKVLIYGFIIKMILFGGFLLIIINFYSFNTVAFVFSFLASFLTFHTLEAIYLKLLFDGKKI